MFCTNCGQRLTDGAGFCSGCGTARAVPYQPPVISPPPPTTQWSPGPVFAPPRPTTPGNGYSTAGIILGAIAFLFLPIVFGPVGIILGAVAKSKGEDKAVVAMVVATLGLVIGMILGAIVFSSINS